jgi:hypothetical protein
MTSYTARIQQPYIPNVRFFPQAGLEVEEDDDIISPESLAVKYKEQVDSDELRKLKEARRISGNRRSRDSGSWNNWAKYGIAALAVGVGLCYSLIRH